jgi:hypothetical protein
MEEAKSLTVFPALPADKSSEGRTTKIEGNMQD